MAGAALNAQVITQNFGSGANAFSIDFVQIGNPGNAPDTTGNPNPVGSVAYTYNIGKYEVSRDQIDKANSAGSLGITMFDMSSGSGIYYLGGNGVNRPATGINWYEAATYVNWLNTSTGGTAAYKFVGGTFTLWSAGDAGYNEANPFRNSLSKYIITSRDEWFKAAYGSPSGTWYNYPTGNDTQPTPVASGIGDNMAVYGGGNLGPADINNAGGLSAYGTMGQGGNVWEWNETAFDGMNNTASEIRELRGGSWSYGSDTLSSEYRLDGYYPSIENGNFGFRVAMIPEPSAVSLLAVGLGALAMMRRRRS